MAQNFDAVDRLMHKSVAQHIFPGAVLAVSRGDALIYDKAFGQADLFSGRPMGRSTCFDLASLTKPLATVLAVMMLVAKGLLDLDQSCAKGCPQLAGSDIANASLRDLLKHRSGLPPWKPFFLRLRGLPFPARRSALQSLVCQTPLVTAPGEREDYSDLGYMVLQWIVEAVAGMNLAEFVHNTIYAPMGIGDLFFTDTRRPVKTPDRFAATQFCPWRHQLMLGHVDDDNAYVSGGIGGHAGLFGTAAAVVQLLQGLMSAVDGDADQGIFDRDIVKPFFHSGPEERWALGFDTPAAEGSSAGRHFPPDSLGHLGFTGTSFWIHRGKKIIVVLLTNRVHPWRFNTGIKAFRPQLHDAVMEALIFE